MDGLDLSNLSPEEYEKIMTVMKRDQMLRKQEEQRILQFKAVSGEWMKELTRSASEKIRSPSTNVLATATENLGRSLKYSFRSGFLKHSNNGNQAEGALSSSKIGSNSETQLNSQHQHPTSTYISPLIGNSVGVINNPSVGGNIDLSSSSAINLTGSDNYRRFYRSRGHPPPKLPTVDSSTLPKSPPSTDGSGSQETSPKPPLSPVIKAAYQAAVELVGNSLPPDTSRTMLNSSPSERKTVYRKVSNRLLSSSSSEEEEDEDDLRPSSQSRASSESTPSPRTPNSCKILSGIAANQATAFKFPPLSPVPTSGRPSPLRPERPVERLPELARTSSDEFGSITPLSSFRSRSTSSETPDETSTSTGGGRDCGLGGPSRSLAPDSGVLRTRRISPLRKQHAIAEELGHNDTSIGKFGHDSSLGVTTGSDSHNNSPLTPSSSNHSSNLKRELSGGADSGIESNYSRKPPGSSWAWYTKEKSSSSGGGLSLGSGGPSSPSTSVSGTPISPGHPLVPTPSRLSRPTSGGPVGSSSRFVANCPLSGSSSNKTTFHRSSPAHSISPANANDDDDDDSESEATVEPTTGYVFRKVTIKKRLNRTQSDRGSPSPVNVGGSPNSVRPFSRSTDSPDRASSIGSPVPSVTASTISPTTAKVASTGHNSLNTNSSTIKSNRNDDPFRRANGTAATYVKSHSAVKPSFGVELIGSEPSKLTNNTNTLPRNSPTLRPNGQGHFSKHQAHSSLYIKSQTNSLKLIKNRSEISSSNYLSSNNNNNCDRIASSEARSQYNNPNTASDRYFSYRLTLPTTNNLTSNDGFAHHTHPYQHCRGNGYHHHQSTSHLHHRLKGLSLDSHAFVRRNIARLGHYGSPAKRRFIKLTKKLRRGLVLLASRFKGRHRKGKSRLSDISDLDTRDSVILERYNVSNGLWLARSASLPNNNEHHKNLAELDSDVTWKFGSIDRRLWQFDDDDDDELGRLSQIIMVDDDEEEYEIGLNDEVIGESKGYQLVFMNNLDCSEGSEITALNSTLMAHDEHLRPEKPIKPKARILRVRSHLEIADGTAYIEDSDWEMCSDPGELMHSSIINGAVVGEATSLFTIYNDYGETLGQLESTSGQIESRQTYLTASSEPAISFRDSSYNSSISLSPRPDQEWITHDQHEYDESLSASFSSRSTSPSSPSTSSFNNHQHRSTNDQLRFLDTGLSDFKVINESEKRKSNKLLLGGYTTKPCLTINHANQDNQVTDWNLESMEPTMMVMMTNKLLGEINASQDTDDQQQQPPCRPPRANRKRVKNKNQQQNKSMNDNYITNQQSITFQERILQSPVIDKSANLHAKLTTIQFIYKNLVDNQCHLLINKINREQQFTLGFDKLPKHWAVRLIDRPSKILLFKLINPSGEGGFMGKVSGEDGYPYKIVVDDDDLNGAARIIILPSGKILKDSHPDNYYYYHQYNSHLINTDDYEESSIHCKANFWLHVTGSCSTLTKGYQPDFSNNYHHYMIYHLINLNNKIRQQQNGDLGSWSSISSVTSHQQQLADFNVSQINCSIFKPIDWFNYNLTTTVNGQIKLWKHFINNLSVTVNPVTSDSPDNQQTMNEIEKDLGKPSDLRVAPILPSPPTCSLSPPEINDDYPAGNIDDDVGTSIRLNSSKDHISDDEIGNEAEPSSIATHGNYRSAFEANHFYLIWPESESTTNFIPKSEIDNSEDKQFNFHETNFVNCLLNQPEVKGEEKLVFIDDCNADNDNQIKFTNAADSIEVNCHNSLKPDQSAELTCLPVQPTTRLCCKPNTHNINKSNANSTFEQPTLFTSYSNGSGTSNINNKFTFATPYVNLVTDNNNEDQNNDLFANSPSFGVNHQHYDQINLDKPLNSQDELIHFSSFNFNPSTSQSTSPRGLSNYHHHPSFVLSVSLQHYCNSLADNIVKLAISFINNNLINISTKPVRTLQHQQKSTATTTLTWLNLYDVNDNCLLTYQNVDQLGDLTNLQTQEDHENQPKVSSSTFLSNYFNSIGENDCVKSFNYKNLPPVTSSSLLPSTDLSTKSCPNKESSLTDTSVNQLTMSLQSTTSTNLPTTASLTSELLLGSPQYDSNLSGDDDENIFDDGSTSSEESMPFPQSNHHSPLSSNYLNSNNYGNPLAYSLHTIIEESESEPESLLSRISEPTINDKNQTTSTTTISSQYQYQQQQQQNQDPFDLTDPENYTAFQIGHNVVNKRGSFAESETEYSDNMSDTSENVADDQDPITLATSRLEKYFTSGLLGSGAYNNYPDEGQPDDARNVNDGYDDDPDDLYNQAKRGEIKVDLDDEPSFQVAKASTISSANYATNQNSFSSEVTDFDTVRRKNDSHGKMFNDSEDAAIENGNRSQICILESINNLTISENKNNFSDNDDNVQSNPEEDDNVDHKKNINRKSDTNSTSNLIQVKSQANNLISNNNNSKYVANTVNSSLDSSNDKSSSSFLHQQQSQQPSQQRINSATLTESSKFQDRSTYSTRISKSLLENIRASDEKSSNRRLGTRNRVMLGGSEPCPSNESISGLPHISVSDYSESFSNRGSIGSSGEEIFTSQEDDIDKAFAFHSRSQTSLSSFGVRSESISSVYSAAGGGRYGTVTVSGEILFSIAYKQSESSLELYIKECRNLSPVDSKRNRSDPYVKVYLLPDRTKSGKRKTKVKKHTLNPIFDETLKFYLPSNQLDCRTLWISVWHSDMFGRNDFLGEVNLPLTKEILKNQGFRWYPLQDRIDLLDQGHNYIGDIFIALKFVPSEHFSSKGTSKNGINGKLLVLVKEAHNLMPTRSNGTSDPFVKCYLLPDKSKKHKTPVVKKTVNPRWNHTFELEDVNTDDIKDRCLELTVWDYDKLANNDFLGGVRLSFGQGTYEGRQVDWLNSSDEEINLWKQMLDRTDMWVYGELRLRSNLQSRHAFPRI